MAPTASGRRMIMAEYIEREAVCNDCKNLKICLDKSTCPVGRASAISSDSLRPKGHWIWKHRYRGGFRQRKGYDAEGNFHIINVDESYEIDDPYCSECGMLNESIFLNFCPNCGADMRGNKNA